MKKSLTFEFKRSFHGKEIRLSLFIGFILVGLDVIFFRKHVDESMGVFYNYLPSAYQAWLLVEYQTPYSHIFLTILQEFLGEKQVV